MISLQIGTENVPEASVMRESVWSVKKPSARQESLAQQSVTTSLTQSDKSPLKGRSDKTDVGV